MIDGHWLNLLVWVIFNRCITGTNNYDFYFKMFIFTGPTFIGPTTIVGHIVLSTKF